MAGQHAFANSTATNHDCPGRGAHWGMATFGLGRRGTTIEPGAWADEPQALRRSQGRDGRLP
jgi:hypothetical protein